MAPGMERFCVYLPPAAEKNMTWKWGYGDCVEFVWRLCGIVKKSN